MYFILAQVIKVLFIKDTNILLNVIFAIINANYVSRKKSCLQENIYYFQTITTNVKLFIFNNRIV